MAGGCVSHGCPGDPSLSREAMCHAWISGTISDADLLRIEAAAGTRLDNPGATRSGADLRGRHRDLPGRPTAARHLPFASVTALDHLGATELRATVKAYRDALAAHREPINRLNVYPVPDGDTGTNMSLTLVSVADDVDAAGDALVDVCAAISKGSLMGARGNSGVILSQVLRGLVSRDRRERRGRRARPGPGDAGRHRRRLPGGHAAGRGHDPHRRARGHRGGRGARGRRCRRRLVAVLEAARTRGRGVARADARPPPGPRRGRRGRRRRRRVPAAARLDAARGRRPPDARARRSGRGRCAPTPTSCTRPSTTRTTACPTCATRSCTSSRRTTRPSPPSRTCGRASATRSWSWAATASGTATSTPTTSAPPSRRPSTAGVPGRSGSPT